MYILRLIHAVGPLNSFIIARRYPRAVYAVSVRLSVTSRSSTKTTKRTITKITLCDNISELDLAHGLEFSDAENLGKIPTGSLLTGAPNRGKDFQPISCYILETVQERDIVTMKRNRNSYVLYQMVLFPATLSDHNYTKPYYRQFVSSFIPS